MPSSLSRRLATLEAEAGPLSADRLRDRARDLTDDEDLLAIVDTLHGLVKNPGALVVPWPEKDRAAEHRPAIEDRLARLAAVNSDAP